MSNLDLMKEQVSALTPADRMLLIDYMLEKLDVIDPAIEKLWVAESEARYEAYKNGEVKAVDWNDIRRELGR